MNKFDRILWRINGVLFLVLLIFGLLPLVWSFVEFRIHPPLRGNGPAIVNQAQGTLEKEFLHLGPPTRINGISVVRMPLHSEAASKGSSFSSHSGDAHTRNYLFVDHSDLSSWWLFETFDRAILKEHDLRADVDGKDKRVIGTIWEVATTDTNGDHRITEEDHIAAFFSAADGKKSIEIIPPSDRILSVDQVTNNQLLIVYQRGAAVTAALFSTQDGSKIKESPLPINK